MFLKLISSAFVFLFNVAPRKFRIMCVSALVTCILFLLDSTDLNYVICHNWKHKPPGHISEDKG